MRLRTELRGRLPGLFLGEIASDVLRAAVSERPTPADCSKSWGRQSRSPSKRGRATGRHDRRVPHRPRLPHAVRLRLIARSATRLPRRPRATPHQRLASRVGAEEWVGPAWLVSGSGGHAPIGSDGAEVARRGYLDGFPLLLESGNGRCVVSTEANPDDRASAGQVGLALRSGASGEPWRQDGGALVTPRCVATDRRPEGRPRAVRCASPHPSLAFLGAMARRGGGWAAGRAAGGEPRSRPETGRPPRARARPPRPFPPLLAGAPARAPRRALRKRPCFLSSLPMATRPRMLASGLSLALGEVSSALAWLLGLG